MQQYYNFTVSDTEISYDPYWYERPNIILNVSIGTFILVLGFLILSFKEAIYISVILISLLFINIYYFSKIKNRTRFVFNKTEDMFYKTTPFGKKKMIRLSAISDISTKSKLKSFYYILYSKNNDVIKKIRLTANIKNKNQNNPEVRFLEMEIIPKLESFLDLDKKTLLFFNSEYCAPI